MVVLVVLATAPELLIAAGVSVAALRVLTLLLQVLVRVLPEPEGENGPESAQGTPSERYGASRTPRTRPAAAFGVLRENYGP